MEIGQTICSVVRSIPNDDLREVARSPEVDLPEWLQVEVCMSDGTGIIVTVGIAVNREACNRCSSVI